ncbi:MAG: glycosyl transferase group 1, partial [Candidatus Marinimicrobia bacterium]|nr:glycosyl transferase group 1 [Candidatus Neomarinimicrobiota bacterium]
MIEYHSLCRVCNSQSRFIMDGKLLDMKVDYFECPACGYVQTETPYWLDRAYAEAINSSDTGIMARNISNVNVVLATLMSMGCYDEKLIDYAGGYGFLVRLLRDAGIDALWYDRYCENLVARGFEYDTGGGGG